MLWTVNKTVKSFFVFFGLKCIFRVKRYFCRIIWPNLRIIWSHLMWFKPSFYHIQLELFRPFFSRLNYLRQRLFAEIGFIFHNLLRNMLTNQNINAALNAAIVWWICVLLLNLALICVDRTDLISNIEFRFSGSAMGQRWLFLESPPIYPTRMKKKHATCLITNKDLIEQSSPKKRKCDMIWCIMKIMRSVHWLAGRMCDMVKYVLKYMCTISVQWIFAKIYAVCSLTFCTHLKILHNSQITWNSTLYICQDYQSITISYMESENTSLSPHIDGFQ